MRLPEHGEGEVLEVRTDKILVGFPGGERKLFKKDYAEAEQERWPREEHS